VDIAEQISDLAQRIAELEASLATLRQEITSMDQTKPGFLKVQGLILLGEQSVGKLKAERAKLATAQK
jgi:hypothetical protein